MGMLYSGKHFRVLLVGCISNFQLLSGSVCGMLMLCHAKLYSCHGDGEQKDLRELKCLVPVKFLKLVKVLNLKFYTKCLACGSVYFFFQPTLMFLFCWLQEKIKCNVDLDK